MNALGFRNPLPIPSGWTPARCGAGVWAAWAVALGPLLGQAADGPPPATRVQTRVSDPAVRPAGGLGCQSCGPGGCRQAHGNHHGHHAGCRDGVCVPYCPVRPQQFGFYGTQWRRWPGSAVVQVSGARDAGPVSPPRSAVPGPSEESLNPQGEPEPAVNPGADAAATPAPVDTPRDTMPQVPGRREPVTAPKQPEAVEPKPEVRREPMDEPQPQPKPIPAEPKPIPAEPKPIPAEPKPIPAEPKPPAPESKPRPEDENLFEVLSDAAPAWRAPRRFAVGPAAVEATVAPNGDRVEPVTHLDQPDPKRVPRVPFDPAAETRRLRATR